MQSQSTQNPLSTGYAELRHVDQALHEAERKLADAHKDFVNRTGPSPQGIYREVLRLRQQARLMLEQLAELFLSEELRGHRPFSETRSPR